MKKSLGMRRFMSLVLALCIVMAMSLTALATEGNVNAAVKEDRTGIVQVNLVYTDENGERFVVQTGTGFMINEINAVTCNHVTQISESTMNKCKDYFGVEEKKIRDRLSIRISVMRDVSIKAKITTNSEEMDFAVLELESKLSGVKALPLRSSEDVSQTEDCFALGFPAEVTSFQDAVTYTSDDVTITYGKVNKVTIIRGVEYVVNSAKVTEGNSGGALLDANGNVIGIIKAKYLVDEMTDSYSYSIATDVLIKTLDRLGISYPGLEEHTDHDPQRKEDDTDVKQEVDKTQLESVIHTAESYDDLSRYTKESADALEAALDSAKSVASNGDATQTMVEDAAGKLNTAITNLELDSRPAIPYWLIGVIAAAVVAIIIVLILIARGGKKSPVGPRGDGAVPPVPPVQPVNNIPPAYPGGGGTAVLGGGMETTVLSGGNETTVLSADFGTLTRISTGEKMTINKERFVIGRERGKADYCIPDNTAIGRIHAIIVNRGGNTYVIDQNSRNCTYVNGVRAGANEEVKIESGDKLTFADESFTYNAH